MGTWSNANHSWNDDDMDSRNLDGTDAKKLRVRNTTVPTPDPEQTHRVEILERAYPNALHNALKINGDVELDYFGTDDQDHLAGSITVEPAGLVINGRAAGEGSVNGDPNVLIGWHGNNPDQGNYVLIDGKEIGIGPGQTPVTGFPVTMKAPVRIPQAATTTGELVVDGKIATSHVDANSYGTDHVL